MHSTRHARLVAALFILLSPVTAVPARALEEARNNPRGDERGGDELVQSTVTLDNGTLFRLERAPEGTADLAIVEPKKEFFFIRPHQPLLSQGSRGPRRRAAAMRFAEEGRRLLEERVPARALLQLERSISLEPSPYAYFYLAVAHRQLEHPRDSLNFLDVAESWLGADPYWMAEIVSLRTANARDLESAMAGGAGNRTRVGLIDKKALSPSATRTPAGYTSLFFALDVGFPLLLLLSCLIWSFRYRNFN